MGVASVARNIAALVLRQGYSKGVYLVLSLLIARSYGRDLLGQYVLALLIPRLFFMMSEMGLNTLLTREVAKAKESLHVYVANLGFLRMLLGGATLFAIVAFARVFYLPGPLFQLICLGGLSYFVVSYLNLLNAAFRALEKMEYEAKVFILRDTVFLLSGLLWLWKWQDLRLLFLFFLVANIGALVYGLWLYRESFRPSAVSVDLGFCRKALQGAKPIWFVSLASILYLYVDSVMLSILKGEAVVGLYNAAFMFVELFILASTILTAAFFPIFSRNAHNPKELQKSYTAVFKLSFFCLLPLQICLLVLAPRWLGLFFGPTFLESAGGLRILMSTALLFAMGSVNAHCLISCKDVAFVAKGVGLFLILNIVLNLWWIPTLSFVGSSLATILCEVLVFAVFFNRILSHTGGISLRPFLGKLFLSGCAMTSCLLFFPEEFVFPLGLFLGLTCYILVDLLMRGYLWQERETFKTLWLEYGTKA